MNKRTIGTSYENKAADFLQENGYEILERNFRCRIGEIDLIAKDGDYLVFIEVKYRRTAAIGLPIEAVDRKKQRVISKVATYYCMQHDLWEQCPCRFDVVAILDDHIEIVKDAFEYQYDRKR